MFKRIGEFFLDILEVVVFSFAIFLFIYTLVLQPHKIKGGSMLPNYIDGELLLTDKVTYRFREPKRGDVIVFAAPNEENEEYIKRIIGLPNEEVSIVNSKVYINGINLDENYLPDSTFTSGRNFLKEGETVKIASESYFVMGDNREYSSDSRNWGFVSRNEITGKAWFVYWPITKIGVVHAVTY